jgi:hypothetical protein
MTDAALEAAIDRVGRNKVFARATRSGLGALRRAAKVGLVDDRS